MRKKLLHLYAGVAGTTELLDESLYDITHVEINPKIAAVIQHRKPNQRVVIGDAHQYLIEHFEEFDIIWSSRPCQSHTRMMKFTRHKLKRFPDFGLYEEIVFLQHFFKGNWIVENVIPYYEPLIPAIRCGRHLIWSNISVIPLEIKQPKNTINLATVPGKQIMMDWLGIHFEENIYYEGNHCPAQVLRNCVHPKLGLHLINQLL